MRIFIIGCIAPLIAACSSVPPHDHAGLDILQSAPVVRYYSKKAPDLYLDWKYVPGRDGASQIAEVIRNSEPGRGASTGN